MDKQSGALAILRTYQNAEYNYLGEGQEGVVFTDRTKVFKVYHRAIPENELVYMSMVLGSLRNSVHLYKIDDIVLFQERTIMIYPYEDSEPIAFLNTKDLVDFLSEMWQRQIIFSNINPKNFIRVNGIIKLIDYELKPYTDNLFLNMCVRAFIHLKYFGHDKDFIKKIERSAINNFDLPELNGIQEFVNNVFSTILFKESRLAIQNFTYQINNNNNNNDNDIIEVPFNNIGNLDTLFYTSLTNGRYLDQIKIKDINLNNDNYFEPTRVQLHYHKITPFRKTVSLIIKTCPQDYETIYATVKHIVKQLSSPNTFLEKIISIDPKERDYPREYTNRGTLEDLIEQVNKLIEEQVIDRYVMLPIEDTANLSNRWFGINTCTTHNSEKVPTTPHLYAFEQAKGEYLFQMDSDVLIGRKDLSHSYLEDMVSEMENNDNVVSVGFNICQDSSVGFKPYFGFETGGFVPEVRIGLFHKERFFSLRPFKNSLDKSGNWQLSWYRSMHEKQKETGYCSIRGGDSRSFYIHPQNYRKSNTDVWTTILDRTENGYIPDCQCNEFDCAGSYYDWTIPKRKEKVVVLCCVRNIDYTHFLRMFCTVISQTYKDWGMIIIDDASDNGLPIFIENIVKQFASKITFVKNRVHQGLVANIYKGIHYFVSNTDSVIVMIDGDDAFIGNNVLENIMRYYDHDGADVVIGRMYETYHLQAHYRYPANFLNPRENNGGNVWQHINSFKKYLFDSLDISDLKLTNQEKKGVSKALSIQWLPLCADYAIMIPIIEMSKNPVMMDYFTYFYEERKTTPQIEEIKRKCISDIINKTPQKHSRVFKGRKTFLPNLNKIEIDITYECNLKCVACNRSCSQAPTKERMEMSDIEAFVSESIELGQKWDMINILGGEPTLHPDFEKIIAYISNQYISLHSPQTVLQIVSNGFTAETRERLERVRSLPNVSIDYNSFKSGNNKIEHFSQFNDAPKDDADFKNADYSQACWITAYSGIGLNKHGYYACDICGGIDRVIGEKKLGIKRLKDITMEKFQEHFIRFCGLCGVFKSYGINNGNFIPRCEKAPFKENIVSESWSKLYAAYISSNYKYQNQNAQITSFAFNERKSFLPNLNKIEIDITYDCNLKCLACNRSCSQAPTKEQMSLGDIKRFVSESVALGKKWDMISILGGEPTMHPDFEKIIAHITNEYVIRYSDQTKLQIVSNGFTSETRELLERAKVHPNILIDYESFKDCNKIEYFTPFNDAPVDDANFKDADYRSACWVTARCGIGLNGYGYYACSICGGIDRVINDINKMGIKCLKDVSIAKLQEHFLKFCCLCGNFKSYSINDGDIIPRCEKTPLKDIFISKTWRELYDNYNVRGGK